jgi:hypothetical protein
VVGPIAYELKTKFEWEVHLVFHVSLLEPYREGGWVQNPPPPIELKGMSMYEVE